MEKMYWYKTSLNAYSNSKIDHLRSLKNGNQKFAFWVLLYRLACEQCCGGLITLSESVPHTVKTLARALRFSKRLVSDALDDLERLELIERLDDGAIIITDWCDDQSEFCQAQQTRTDAVKKSNDKRREQNRLAKQRQREREKLAKLAADNVINDVNDVSNDVSIVSIDINKINNKKTDKEKDIEAEAEKDARERECTAVQELYNGICTSYPKIALLSKRQRRDLLSTLDEVGIEQLKRCFELAEESDFLKGKGWASFDWLIRPENIAKVCNGNYRNDSALYSHCNAPSEVSETLSSFDADEFFEAALARGFDD